MPGSAGAEHRAYDLGYHVAGLAHDDGVAGPDVFQPDLVLVVKARQAHDRAGDTHGYQLRERCRSPGPADRDEDVVEASRLLLGRELVGDGPTGRMGGGTEARVKPEIVHLHDDAVDLVAEAVAASLDVAAVGEHGLEVGYKLGLRVHRQAGAPEKVQRLRLGGQARDAGHLVEEGPECPTGGDGGVLLAK